MIRIALCAACALLAACTPSTGTDQQISAFDEIAPDETIHFLGTEPFWGGETSAGQLTYNTPENIDGTTIAVRRFAGNSGIGLSGTLDDASFDMTVTQGTCSDGMSDATYPFTVTLRIGKEIRRGCAWTDSQPRSRPEAS